MTINSEQIQALKARYAEPETPNCRICGAKMSIQRAGGGSLVYGCDGRVEGDGYAFKEGRAFADKHYEQSRETVYNMGDADVMALLAERDADKALIAEQAKRIVQLEISCDRNYVEGMKTGWNYCDAGNSEGFNTCVEQREKDIRDARTAGITLDVGE